MNNFVIMNQRLDLYASYIIPLPHLQNDQSSFGIAISSLMFFF